MSYEDGKIVAEALLGTLDEATCEWDWQQEIVVVFPKDLRRTTKVISLNGDKLIVCRKNQAVIFQNQGAGDRGLLRS